jgi:hypothetical protein
MSKVSFLLKKCRGMGRKVYELYRIHLAFTFRLAYNFNLG